MSRPPVKYPFPIFPDSSTSLPYDPWTDPVIHLYKCSAPFPFSQIGIPEPPQDPYLRTVIRSVNTGRDITALGGTVRTIPSCQVPVAVALLIEFGIIVIVPAQKVRLRASGLMAFLIVVAITTCQVLIGLSCFVPFCIIMIIAAKEIGLAVACLMAMAIIVVIATCKVFICPSLVAHHSDPHNINKLRLISFFTLFQCIHKCSHRPGHLQYEIRFIFPFAELPDPGIEILISCIFH